MRTKGGRRGSQGAGACARLSCNGFVYAVVHLHAAAVLQSCSLDLGERLLASYCVHGEAAADCNCCS